MGKQPPMTKRNGDPNRSNSFDRCQTPPYALDALYQWLPDHWIIWEPFAGKGNIYQALKAQGHKVIASDILPQEECGPGIIGGKNFLIWQPDVRDLHWHCIVSNPPYSVKPQMISRCYQLGKPWALLMPVQTVDSQKTQAMFEEFGVQYIYMDRRVNFEMLVKGYDGNGAQFMTQWFTWRLALPKQINFFKTWKGWNSHEQTTKRKSGRSALFPQGQLL